MKDAQPPDDDAGEPVAELAGLAWEPGLGFWGRLRRRIERRLTAAQVAAFGWDGPKAVLLEFLEFFFQLFSPARDSGRGGKS